MREAARLPEVASEASPLPPPSLRVGAWSRAGGAAALLVFWGWLPLLWVGLPCSHISSRYPQGQERSLELRFGPRSPPLPLLSFQLVQKHSRVIWKDLGLLREVDRSEQHSNIYNFVLSPLSCNESFLWLLSPKKL